MIHWYCLQARWKETLSELKSEEGVFLGGVVLVSACLSYLGPFPPPQRTALLSKWKKVCEETNVVINKKFTLEDSLGEPDQVGWRAQHVIFLSPLFLSRILNLQTDKKKEKN